MNRVDYSTAGAAVEVPGMPSLPNRYGADLNRSFGQRQREIKPEESVLIPPISGEISFLLKYGIPMSLLQQVERRARALDLPAADVLLANGHVSEVEYYGLMARELGLAFCPTVPRGHDILPHLPGPDQWHRLARLAFHAPQCSHSLFNARQAEFFMAPDGQQLRRLGQLLRQYPHFANRIRITTHKAGMNHLLRRARPALLEQARNGLSQGHPALSAQRVITVPQTLIGFAMAQILVIVGVWADGFVLVAAHLPALFAYFSQAGLRFAGWLRLLPSRQLAIERRMADESLPTYSVLVALYKEANQVERLVAALARLDWPVEKLEIKLVLEDDDLDTISACHRALELQSLAIISIVTVPVSLPRTKPKALNYALPLCSGDYLVVFDAEDSPDPGQLREAHAAFLAGPPDLACLQAPLCIHNAADGFLPRLFAIEYAAHFDGLLPALEKIGFPILLGGSSNHFKRTALVNIGGWDPYNVTEDADLGIRFARAGCAVGTIHRPTFEEAPRGFGDWLCQRTRWFKGCYQTWLVHMRHPLVLYSDLGPIKFFGFQLLTLGAAAGALFQPFLIYFMTKCLMDIGAATTPTLSYVLAYLDLFSVLLVILAWCLLAAQTLSLRNLQSLRPYLCWTLIYWLLISIAAWRALWQLCTRPHEWEKTPHGSDAKPIA